MIEFDKYQKEAIKLSLTNRYKKVFISGVAGSGKSAIINYIKKEFNKNNIKYNVVAPTNMAAKNIEGKTLHIEFNMIPSENIEAKSEDGFILFDNFSNDEDKLSKYDKILIVDEVSMVGKNLLSKTLDKSIYTKMILFGDLEQLKPVKDKKVDYTKYVDKHIHLENNYRATNPIVSKWIAEFRNTHKLNPNIPKFNLNMFDKDTYIIGYTNKAISKILDDNNAYFETIWQQINSKKYKGAILKSIINRNLTIQISSSYKSQLLKELKSGAVIDNSLNFTDPFFKLWMIKKIL